MTTPKINRIFGKKRDKNKEKITPKIAILLFIFITIGIDTNIQIKELNIVFLMYDDAPTNSSIKINEKLTRYVKIKLI